MEDRLLEYLDAAEAALAEYGPMAAEGMLMWARIDAASALIVSGVFFVATTIGAVAIGRWGRRLATRRADYWLSTEKHYTGLRDYRAGEWQQFGIFASLAPWVAPVALSIPLLNIWRWVGVFAPEMWLVHKAVNAIGG